MNGIESNVLAKLPRREKKKMGIMMIVVWGLLHIADSVGKP